MVTICDIYTSCEAGKRQHKGKWPISHYDKEVKKELWEGGK